MMVFGNWGSLFLWSKSCCVEIILTMKLIVDAWCSSSRPWVYWWIKWLLQARVLETERIGHLEVHSGALHSHMAFCPISSCLSCQVNAFCRSSVCCLSITALLLKFSSFTLSINVQKRKERWKSILEFYTEHISFETLIYKNEHIVLQLQICEINALVKKLGFQKC